MTENNHCNEQAIQDTVAYLVMQQFIGTDDVVYGRTREVSVHIPGATGLVKRLIAILLEPIKLLLEDFPDQYLEQVNSEFPFNVERILTKYTQSLGMLEAEERSPEILITLMVSEILMSIRTNLFQEFMDRVEIMAKKRLGSSNQRKYIAETIGELYSKNNENVSILYNLTFLLYLSDQYRCKKVARQTMKEILHRFDLLVNDIVEKIQSCHA